MHDFYHIPALVLTFLLLPAFGFLYLRFRDTRTLLWLLGFLLAMVRMVQHYRLGWWDFSNAGIHPWLAAAGETSVLISSALFLASLSPLRFRIGRLKLLYVIPFVLPLAVFSILFEGVFHGIAPSGPLFLVFAALGSISVVVAFLWGVQNDTTPSWLGGSICGAAGVFTLWAFFTQGASFAVVSTECSAHLVTAILVVFVFRRFTPGVFLSVLGFTAWSFTILEALPWVVANPQVETSLIRAIVLSKVVAAVGMILLALEDELAINTAAKERERRARVELEAYANLTLSRRRVEDFDRQGPEICQTVVENSRFAQAALLLLDNSGRYRLAGSAGLGAAIATALGALAGRIPVEGFLAPDSALPAIDHSQTFKLELQPWFGPGDDLKRMHFTSVLAVPMNGRSATEGALLLAGMRNSQGRSRVPLRLDDLLPVEMLTARLQASRSQTTMLEKLIDSEKFAGLGQLAGNVTQQLNNPLTVILGYASLLEEAQDLAPQERKGVDAILSEARRMRSTLESLSRISRTQADQLAAVSVSELLADLEELHRSDFLHRSIELRMSIAPGLPRVLCHAQQLRQAVLHCLQFAMEAVGNQERSRVPDEARVVRLEATAEETTFRFWLRTLVQAFCTPIAHSTPLCPRR